MTDTLIFIYDYGGLAIGLVLLIAACFFLPAKIRWYVLTAGLTLILFRAWQIYDGRKKLKAADEERKKLRAHHQELEQWLEQLRGENENLRKEKENIEQERDRLRNESEQLDLTAAENTRKKQELDSKAEQLLNDSRNNAEARAKQLSAIEKAIALKRQFTQLAGDTE